MWRYVLLICTASVVTQSREEGCVFTTVERCLRALTAASSVSRVKSYNATELAAYCSAADAFGQCISQFVHSCPLKTQNQLNDMVDSDAYLCSEEGSELMVQNYECFRQNDTEALMRNCSLKFFDPTYKEDVSDGEWCDLLKEGLNCVLTGMTEICGQDAGRLIHQLQLTAHKHSSVENNCTLSPMTYSGSCTLTPTTASDSAAVQSHHLFFLTFVLTLISMTTTIQCHLL
ncbi:hypothetical protein CAPTEDRAFT_202854 [Capitella teleta]|uniref:DUF19 domain-containing protein n=1 Tax=Capitella teleta TaxID=283909 RepID=R7UJ25_CAPTE|nr:hypothetical protein CAPTEDRAFT_202854 [Capitella teleta]|eukprot:ELU06068.1 hypothetical protein CAPTEDRAFT_202854 [Capitella teleta]